MGHPKFGQVFRCECALPGFHEQQQQRARAASNLTQTLRVKDFGSYRRTRDNTEAFQTMSGFANATRGWVVLQGGRGMGKTHLMAAVANYLLDHPFMPEDNISLAAKRGRAWPLYVVAPDFLAYVRSGYDAEARAFNESAEERIQQAINADVLLLDDLGAEQRTQWSDETLYRVLNARYNDMRPTVIATNEPMNRLEPRIASRMQDWRFSLVVAMSGSDERLRRPSATTTGTQAAMEVSS